jgi:UDP-GlcNAc:undecaprenyl-phosphate GlcNAc-1-phosphate transferase
MHIDFNLLELTGIGLSLIVSIAILSFAEPIGRALRVMDRPDNVRKIHARPTPLVGGLAIAVPLLLWSLAGIIWPVLAEGGKVPLAGIVCGTGAALLGFFDDRRPLSPTLRLVTLLVLTVLALLINDKLVPAQFHWGHLSSTPVTPWLAYALVAVGMAGFVNSVNMADGHDGCAAGMFAIWAACMILCSGGSTADLAAILLLTSLAVLAFNLRGKVFLGGTGAYGVTFLFGLLILRLHNHWGVTAETIIAWLFIPIVDCLRLMVMRPLQGRSPFEADRNHFHHRLHDRFGKAGGLTIYLGVVAIFSLTATVAPDTAPACVAILACIYVSLMLMTSEAGVRAVPIKITRPD